MTGTPPLSVDLVSDLVRWGLVDDGSTGTSVVPLDDGEEGAFVDEVVLAGLVGVLSAAVDAGEVEIDASARELLHERQRAAMVWCLRLESHLLACLDVLAEVGIDALVVKGSAAAHLDAVDPSLRPFSDIDLLVRSDDVEGAVAALVRHGATRRWPERRPGFDARFAKSVTLRWPDGIEVDLHRMLADGAFGRRVPEDPLFGATDSFVLGGHTVRCLAGPQRLLHNAMHLVLGSPTPRPINVRDLVGQLRDESLEPEVVVAEATEWRIDTVVAEAVAVVTDAVGVSPTPWPAWERWAGEHRPVGNDRAIMERQRLEGSGIGRAKVDALWAMPSWNQRLAYGWALAAPTRDHRRSHGHTLRRGQSR